MTVIEGDERAVRPEPWSDDRTESGLEPLVGVVQDLSLARDLPTIMEVVRLAARALTGADGASFVLREGDRCYYAEENAVGPLWKGLRFPISACISGWVMLHREAVAIEDVYEDPRVPVDAYRPTFVKSLCMVPIRTKAPIGAIGNYWGCRHRATAHELAVLQALADSTSVAMENVAIYAQLEDRVRHRTRELEARTRELAEKNAALLDLQRQKEALASLVVHDLRSPASSIMLTASGQLRKDALPAAERCRWRAVFSSTEHIARTAGNLLDIARSDDGRLVPKLTDVDLASVLAETRELLGPLAERREQAIDVRCDVPSGALRADPNLLGRVLQNLVDNALRHSPAASVVRIGARADSEWVTLVVADEGSGIPIEMRERTFEPYVRLEEGGAGSARSAGWGLGLSFCRMAVEAHGGAIWIEDNAPRGTRFCFRLPVTRPSHDD